MQPLTITDLENFALGKQGVQNSNNQYQMETNLTPAEQNLIKANLAFTNFFLDDDLEGTQFTFTVQNVNAASRSIYLLRQQDTIIDPTLSLTGTLKEGAFNDTNNAAGASASSGTSGVTIDSVVAYLQNKSVEVVRIRATFSDTQQAAQSLVLSAINPLQIIRDKTFNFTDDRLKGVPDQITYDLTTPILLSSDVALKYTLLGGSAEIPNRVTFTFYFGLQMKTSKLFKGMIDLYNASAKQVAPNGVVTGISNDVRVLQTSPVAALL
jgi:hypothetical protein